jgi:hypothetical protein
MTKGLEGKCPATQERTLFSWPTAFGNPALHEAGCAGCRLLRWLFSMRHSPVQPRDSRAARVYLPLQLVSLLPPLNSALHEVGCTGHGMLRWLLLMRCSLDPQSGLFQVGLDVTILRY